MITTDQEYQRLKEFVEEHLYLYFPKESKEARTVFEAMKYSLGAGGKRIRPVLLLSACKAAGGKEEDAMPFACALEYIHTYSLIHDDLPAMDNDDLRRGKPTNHKVYGEATAILAGDGLLNAAYETMMGDIWETAQKDGEEEMTARKIRAAHIIARAAGVCGMVGGQTADVLAEKQGAFFDGTFMGIQEKRRLLEFIHKNKTGALMRAALGAGGAIGGAGGQFLSDLETFGEKLGLAFQIADDILDICADTKTLGKPAKSDVENEKLTYPALLGLSEAKRCFQMIHSEALAALKPYGENVRFLLEEAEALAKRNF